jgi:hypothetical protein
VWKALLFTGPVEHIQKSPPPQQESGSPWANGGQRLGFRNGQPCRILALALWVALCISEPWLPLLYRVTSQEMPPQRAVLRAQCHQGSTLLSVALTLALTKSAMAAPPQACPRWLISRPRCACVPELVQTEIKTRSCQAAGGPALLACIVLRDVVEKAGNRVWCVRAKQRRLERGQGTQQEGPLTCAAAPAGCAACQSVSTRLASHGAARAP